MLIRASIVGVVCGGLWACSSTDSARTTRASAAAGASAAPSPARSIRASQPPEPLVIGESFTIDSRVMGEPRRVNVLVPTVYGEKIKGPLPVLYMLDGGLDEDFLHIAGLVQILVSDGSMRPFVLVGIPNTSRRRDMTGPTSNPEDRKIAPIVGGSAAFRRFIKEELMPAVRARYDTTPEAALVGESLAGLFVVETYFLEPDLFHTCIAVDPSLWWDHDALVKSAGARLAAPNPGRSTLYIASSNEPVIAGCCARLAAAFSADSSTVPGFRYQPMPEESHATIYHPAALRAFRTVLSPPAPSPK